MTDELFAEIEARLAERAEVLRGRARFKTAMKRAEREAELWAALQPFIQTPDDHKAAAEFMAYCTRAHARD